MLIFTGTWLKRKREALGLSQALFAKCVGGTTESVSDMESGNLVLDFDLIRRIYIFLQEHFDIPELCSNHEDLIQELYNQRIILGEDRAIYVGYRLIAYEEFQDFYDFNGFVIHEDDFRNRRRNGYYGTGTVIYERWIEMDIETAIGIFEMQQGIMPEVR